MLVVLPLLLVKLIVVIKTLHFLLFRSCRVLLRSLGFFDLLRVTQILRWLFLFRFRLGGFFRFFCFFVGFLHFYSILV